MMELFSYAIFKRCPRPLGLCRLGKRAPNWLLKTKGNWPKSFYNSEQKKITSGKNAGTGRE
jgi:hypothetical protein